MLAKAASLLDKLVTKYGDEVATAVARYSDEAAGVVARNNTMGRIATPIGGDALPAQIVKVIKKRES